MNIGQAYKMMDYGTVPRQRQEQIGLIKIMGYTRMRGGRLLSECPDQQLYQVAGRLFREAENMVLAELNAQTREMSEEEGLIRYPKFLVQYHAFLCDLFNIPESQRENHSINELEAQLMQ